LPAVPRHVAVHRAMQESMARNLARRPSTPN
jgi:hypothetical protein